MAEPLLVVKGASKSYGDLVALEPLDLTVPRRATGRARRPQRLGQVDVAAADRGTARAHRRHHRHRRRAGRVGRRSCADELRTGRPGAVRRPERARAPRLRRQPPRCRSGGVATSTSCSSMVGLIHRADDLPARFSRGLRQKTSLALGVVRPCRLLLVDEPFVGLDATGKLALLDLLDSLHDAGVTTLVATHDPQLRRASVALHRVARRRGHPRRQGDTRRRPPPRRRLAFGTSRASRYWLRSGFVHKAAPWKRVPSVLRPTYVKVTPDAGVDAPSRSRAGPRDPGSPRPSVNVTPTSAVPSVLRRDTERDHVATTVRRVLRLELAFGREVDAPLLVAEEAVRAAHRSRALDPARSFELAGVDDDRRRHHRTRRNLRHRVGARQCGCRERTARRRCCRLRVRRRSRVGNADDPRMTSDRGVGAWRCSTTRCTRP